MPAMKMHPAERIAEYTGKGWWTDETVQQLFADRVARVRRRPRHGRPAQQAATWSTCDPAGHLERAGHGRSTRWPRCCLDNGIGEGSCSRSNCRTSSSSAVVYLAGWRVRAIVSPLPVQYRRHEIVELGNIAGLDAFLTSDRIGNRAAAADVVGMRPEIPSLRTVLYFGPGRGRRRRQHRPSGGRAGRAATAPGWPPTPTRTRSIPTTASRSAGHPAPRAGRRACRGRTTNGW